MVFLLVKSCFRKYTKKCTLSLIIYGVIGLFLHLWILRYLIMFLTNITTLSKDISNVRQEIEDISYLFTKTKHILLWHDYYLLRDKILSRVYCSLKKCIVTKDRGLLGDYINFDAIVFHEKWLYNEKERPTRRNQSQLYIFTTIESPTNFPACELYNDDFFNWTFTYRLDSDVPWHYFIVKDAKGNLVAPSVKVKWRKNLNVSIDSRIKAIVQGRTRAAVWIVSHCEATSFRDTYITRLQEDLFNYGLQIDVYGKCSKESCGDFYECENMVRTHYYFYMAFENSMAEDYVTEKVLHGYDNYVVPIVYGAANYTRFLPPGSYINAMDFHPYNLAGLMNELIRYPKKYEKYLQWTNLYTFESKPHTYHPVCDLCDALNSKKANHAPAKKNFRFWWNTLNGMKWCLPSDYWNETVKNNVDGSHLVHRNNNLY